MKSILTDLIIESEQRSKPIIRSENNYKQLKPAVKRKNITHQNKKLNLKRSPSMALKLSNGTTSSINQNSVEQNPSQSCVLILVAEDQKT